MVARLLAALAIAVLGLAAAWGSRRGVLPRLLLRRPYVAGLAIGLVWWRLLTPSVFGFGLTVACLAAGAWSYWRKRTIAGSPTASVP
jgi:mannose/fructose/N-acetylgalactosamine-specific phosphotransferase system component IIC